MGGRAGLLGTGRNIMLSVLVDLGIFLSSGGFGIFPCTKNAHLLDSNTEVLDFTTITYIVIVLKSSEISLVKFLGKIFPDAIILCF